MGIEDNKTFSLNISLKQVLVIVALFALCVVAIYLNALNVGYVVVTLALCAFFLAVAFDFGISRRGQERLADAPEPAPAAPRRPGGTRTARNA
jgi:hypothetical protein